MEIKRKNGNVLLIVLGVLLIVVLAAGTYIYNRYNKINFKKVNKEDLGIEENHLEKIKDEVENSSNLDTIKNILVIGSDTRNDTNMYSGRSDSIMILSINPSKNLVKLISIPRDTYVAVEGYGNTKLNHSFAYGKEQLLLKTINQNFNLNISEYVTIDFTGVANIVDEIGGIDIEVSEEEKTFINKNIGEITRIRNKKSQPLNESGLVKLDGNQALTYSRDRQNGNDFTREERQRKVIKKIFEKATSLNIKDATSFVDTCLENVTTNINIPDYISLIPSILKNKDNYINNIVTIQFPDEQYATGQRISGVYYFVPNNIEDVKNRFSQLLYN